jgi:hypothetical protein
VTLLYQTATLRADAHRNLPLPRNEDHSAIRDKVVNILNQAKALESGFQMWNDCTPLNYQYQVVERDEYAFRNTDDSVGLMNSPGRPDHLHIYQEIITAPRWNLFRAARVLLNQTIADCCIRLIHNPPLVASPFSLDGQDFAADMNSIAEHEAMLAQAIDISVEMSDAICASVDTHLSPSSSRPGSIYPSPVSSPRSSARDKLHGQAGALKGYSLLFPLWVAMLSTEAIITSPSFSSVLGGAVAMSPVSVSSAPALPSRQQAEEMERKCAWVKRVLVYIHHALGIAQAGAIGRKSVQQEKRRGWRW